MMRERWRTATTMRKSTVIATCLVNSNMIGDFEDAEHIVRRIFTEEFLDLSFDDWERDIDDSIAQNIIRNVGTASRINVVQFIEDLR